VDRKWKIIFGIVLLAILAGGGLYAGKMISKAREYNELIDKGSDLLLNGRHDLALPYFQQALRIRPKSFDPHYGLGAIYLQQRNLQAAVDELELAIKINPDAVEAHYSLGVAYHRMKNYPLALREYTLVAQINPSAKIYNNLGALYLDRGDYKEALDYFNKAIEKDPRYVQTYLNLGNLYEKQGKGSRAIEQYEFVIKEASNNPFDSRFAEIAKRRIRELKR